MTAKYIKMGGVQYVRADAVEQQDVAEVVKLVLAEAGITVEQICTLADNLKALCANDENENSD